MEPKRERVGEEGRKRAGMEVGTHSMELDSVVIN